jgi:hypothetical protein
MYDNGRMATREIPLIAGKNTLEDIQPDTVS